MGNKQKRIDVSPINVVPGIDKYARCFIYTGSRIKHFLSKCAIT